MYRRIRSRLPSWCHAESWQEPPSASRTYIALGTSTRGSLRSPRALCRRPLRGLVQSFPKVYGQLSSKLTHYQFADSTLLRKRVSVSFEPPQLLFRPTSKISAFR